MDSITEHRERIAAALRVDELFGAYEIEMAPDEALAFAEKAPIAGVPSTASLHTLIDRVNAAIPPVNFGAEHPQTGRFHHHFRVGRQRGNRTIKIEIFKGFFQVDYNFMDLMETLHADGVGAGADVVIHAGNNSYSIELLWGSKHD